MIFPAFDAGDGPVPRGRLHRSCFSHKAATRRVVGNEVHFLSIVYPGYMESTTCIFGRESSGL